MIVSAIVAVAQNGVIGKHNQIPWYLPADMQFFKRTTLHHHVIMGRLSFLSIGRPLPKRTNIVLTRDPFFTATGCLVARNIEEALDMAFDHGETEAFIIGGGDIYTISLPYWDKLYFTEVQVEPEGDIYFPKLNWQEWHLVSAEPHQKDDKNEYDYTFKVFERERLP